MSKNVEQQPSRTAMLATLSRAIAHKEFNNGIFGSDYLAEYFIPFLFRFFIKSKRARTRMKQRIPMGVYEYLIARTQYFDNLFRDALNKGIPQIVLLGAGYDTRAYRFAKKNNNTRIIEIDITTTQNRKKECLKRAKIEIPANVEFIPLNFNKDSLEDVLMEKGFKKHEKTLFLWEGVSYYLESESVNATLEQVKNISHKESLMAFDYAIFIPLEEKSKYYGVKESYDYMIEKNPNERVKFSIKEDTIGGFLKQRGFKVVEHLNNTEIEKRFLTKEKGLLIGQIMASFRCVLASPLDNAQNK